MTEYVFVGRILKYRVEFFINLYGIKNKYLPVVVRGLGVQQKLRGYRGPARGGSDRVL